MPWHTICQDQDNCNLRQVFNCESLEIVNRESFSLLESKKLTDSRSGKLSRDDMGKTPKLEQITVRRLKRPIRGFDINSQQHAGAGSHETRNRGPVLQASSIA